MKSDLLVKVVAEYLCERCRELGYIPQVTKLHPHNRVFPSTPSSSALFVKLFGNNNWSLNSVHCRWGVLDPQNLSELGSLDEENLTLTEMDKFLLIQKILERAGLKKTQTQILELAKQTRTLQEVKDFLVNY